MNNYSVTTANYIVELYCKNTKTWHTLSVHDSRSEAEADLASFVEYRDPNNEHSQYVEAKISLKTVKTETIKETLKMIEL